MRTGTRGESELERESRRNYQPAIGVRHRRGRHHRRLHVRLRQRRDQRHAGRPSKHFQPERRMAGRHRERPVARLRAGRLSGGSVRRPVGPASGHGLCSSPVHPERARRRRGHLGHHDDRGAICRRRGRRRGERSVPGLHQRSDAREHARTSLEHAAGHDHRGPDGSVLRELLPGGHRRQIHGRTVAGICCMAMDVLDANHPGQRLLRDAAVHSGEPALPGGARQAGGGQSRSHEAIRRGDGGFESAGNPRLPRRRSRAAPVRSHR